jgi:hypothetical protein
MLASFAGWGWGLSRAARVEGRVDWPLRAAWGMAVVVALGGVLVAARCATAAACAALVAGGLALLAAGIVAEPPRPRRLGRRLRAGPLFAAGCAAAVLLLGLGWVSSLGHRGDFYWFDDGPAYLVFPRQLAQTGAMDQPFSFRRLTSYGAQSFLQAMLLAGADPPAVPLFDEGLCTTILVGLVLADPRTRAAAPRALTLLAAAIVLLLPDYRMNVAAVQSGTVVFYAMYRTLALERWAAPGDAPRWAILGLLAAAACALRPFFAVAALAVVAFGALAAADRRGAERAGTARTAATVSAAVTGLALLPWAWALERSCGTPMFPPFQGFYQPASHFADSSGGAFRVRMIVDVALCTEPILTIHLFLLASLLMRDRTPRGAARASCAGLLVGFVVLQLLIPISDWRSLIRYRLPMELAFVLVVSARAWSPFRRPLEPRAIAAGATVLVASAVHLYAGLEGSGHAIQAALDQAAKPRRAEWLAEADADRRYAAIQASVPAGARMLVMLDEPFRLDFRRNPVLILDMPTIVGPGGDFPIGRGPEALAAHLRAQGIQYLAALRPDRSELYSAETWRDHARTDDGMPQHRLAPRVLDVYDSIEKLRATRRSAYDDGSVSVFEL